MSSKKQQFGQYFTKEKAVQSFISLLNKYSLLHSRMSILEPSSGNGVFIEVLKKNEYFNISSCEIDPSLTSKPQDFFELSLEHTFDLIIGNPPFSKYNLPTSFYSIESYKKSSVSNSFYLPKFVLEKSKEKIELCFLLKSLIHLNSHPTIAFVLPVSFWIENHHSKIKKLLLEYFDTIIIYQDSTSWFDYSLPCCFTVFTNNSSKKGIILEYESNETILPISSIYEEIIPKTYFAKQKFNSSSLLLDYIEEKSLSIKKSFTSNNVSASTILNKKYVSSSNIENYKLAVVRVGNSSVGKAGLIDISNDCINDMFYVFDFKEKYQYNKSMKEFICEKINKQQEYFQSITLRIGSKSLKKKDILNCPI